MIYSDQDIRLALESGAISIEPRPAPASFATSSVDLRLGDTFTVFGAPLPGTEISVMVGQADPEETARRYGNVVNVPIDSYIELRPNTFALAYTMERVALPLNLAARVEGKSSVARWGLSIHQTAPTIHAGFEGHIRLEIANIGPFVCRLTPGTQICQLIIEELRTVPVEPLRSRFQNQSPD